MCPLLNSTQNTTPSPVQFLISPLHGKPLRRGTAQLPKAYPWFPQTRKRKVGYAAQGCADLQFLRSFVKQAYRRFTARQRLYKDVINARGFDAAAGHTFLILVNRNQIRIL